uniref:Peptidase family M48 n=1 Tax=Candidatus Kentrum sp. TUN TaxID=2126343 RepID=A0A451A617_9GAMM|nr:MAG: Peptidase family M48 [Candidatus Kentron sp. TUN]
MIIHAPAVRKRLQRIIDKLKTAANQAQTKITLYIVGSPEINALAIPPGDIFLTSGLLNTLNSRDELAAVLAHEIDHLFQHDAAAKLLGRDKTGKKAFFIGLGTTVIGSAIAAGSTDIAARNPTTSTLTSLVRDISAKGIHATSLSVAESLGRGMVGGYSQETELRADRNSARYLLAAGYDVDAALRMLKKLEVVREKAEMRDEARASRLVNARPGLEARIEQMQKTIKKIRTSGNKH